MAIFDNTKFDWLRDFRTKNFGEGELAIIAEIMLVDISHSSNRTSSRGHCFGI